jgi:class 3 adenylate cyclase
LCVVFGLFDLGPELSPFARPFREFPSSSRSVTTSVLLIIPNVVIPGLALGSLTLIFISRSKAYQQRISEMLLDTGIPSDVIAYSTSVRPPPFGFHFDFLAFGFIDIVGFTQWTSSVLPEVMLSTLVEYFDAIKNVKGPFERVEIVKFIGDSIMFVSGRPKLSPSGRRSKRARGPKGANLSGSLAPAAETYGTESIMSTDDTNVSLDSHERTAAVDELLNFLKRVMEVISTTPFGPESKKFQLRAGVEAGECIGGLLKSGAMDYYGDTVNVASRLEGTGSPGMIHLSRTVMSYASPKKGMAFGPVTRTEIKGHQALDTVLLWQRQSMRLAKPLFFFENDFGVEIVPRFSWIRCCCQAARPCSHRRRPRRVISTPFSPPPRKFQSCILIQKTNRNKKKKKKKR